MKRFIREPLLHFLLLGALIFAAFKIISGDDASRPSKIVVTQGRIESLAVAFARTWRRPPTTAELEGLVRDYVREELYAREAMALGLDKDDTIIRRRLRQKLEFISEDVANQVDPSEEQLRAHLTQHPAFSAPTAGLRSTRSISTRSSAAGISNATRRKCSRSCSRPEERPMLHRSAIH